jgi:general stress protein 26
MTQTPSERRRFVGLLRSFDTAMLATRTSDGALRARPMAIARVDDDGTTWFVSDADAPKAQEIGQRSEVAVVMQSDSAWASLSGRASTVLDRELLRAMWNESFRPWFPEGPDHPEIVLIRVEPAIGEYWDRRGARGLRHLWDAARAYASGRSPDEDLAHGKLEL